MPRPPMPTSSNKVLPTAVSQWERDELEASAARMRAIYNQADRPKLNPNPNIGPTQGLRAKILGLSLFPNLYNRAYSMKEGATTS